MEITIEELKELAIFQNRMQSIEITLERMENIVQEIREKVL